MGGGGHPFDCSSLTFTSSSSESARVHPPIRQHELLPPQAPAPQLRLPSLGQPPEFTPLLAPTHKNGRLPLDVPVKQPEKSTSWTQASGPCEIICLILVSKKSSSSKGSKGTRKGNQCKHLDPYVNRLGVHNRLFCARLHHHFHGQRIYMESRPKCGGPSRTLPHILDIYDTLKPANA